MQAKGCEREKATGARQRSVAHIQVERQEGHGVEDKELAARRGRGGSAPRHAGRQKVSLNGAAACRPRA